MISSDLAANDARPVNLPSQDDLFHLFPISPDQAPPTGTFESSQPTFSAASSETMGLEGGVYLYHTMTPSPNLGHAWVIFEGWSQILSST